MHIDTVVSERGLLDSGCTACRDWQSKAAVEEVVIMYGPPPDCKRFEVERSNESA
jgi:hypothetical protein